MHMRFYRYENHYMDEMVNKTLIDLRTLEMTRRKFAKDAFRVEIATPNDDNTAPDNCAKISEYKTYYPKVTIAEGGHKNNQLYVGTKLKFSAPDGNASVSIKEVLVFKDGEIFDKFKTGQDTDGNKTITLVGKINENKGLTLDEIENGKYTFRVIYERKTRVTINLSNSLPRDEGLSEDKKFAQLFDNYRGSEDHCFGDGEIKVGFSLYDETLNDYNGKDTGYGNLLCADW